MTLTNNLKRPLSKQAFEEAISIIPGGVNSPVRALKAVGETPLYIESAKDVTLKDIDGNTYIDFCLSWGVFIAGHANPIVENAVQKAISNGTSYGIPTLIETELAKKVRQYIPSMERVRFVNSGTEAVMSAIRLARGYTKRNYILKFEGCYHGHADHLLVAAGSGVATFGRSASSGVPNDFAKYTLVAPFNDKEAVKQLFEKYGKDIAAVIVEPVPANMGVVPEQENFLSFLRDKTNRYHSLLIFDEVITGFRLLLGGAQTYYNITPDLTTVGKIVGGGFPSAAFGGKKEIMQMLAPDGPVYQAGTLSGNPIAMTAGLATLSILETPGIYEQLNNKAERFINRLSEVLKPHGIVINHVGNMFTPFFTNNQHPKNFKEVSQSNTDEFGHFWRYMLNHGIYFSPSQFESNFVSIQHSETQLDEIIEIAKQWG